MIERHPESGLHYAVVIPPDHGPFSDIRACYEHVARRSPWMTIVSPGQPIEYRDRALFVLHWLPTDDVPARSERGATTALVYSEALDPDFAKVAPAHRAHWERVQAACSAGRWDGVLGHTPYMAELLSMGLGRTPTAVLPVGWEPEAMGRPRGTHKVHGMVYHGSMMGRRHVLVPYLAARLGRHLVDASGQYGRGLLGALEAAYASLYIAHSPVASFSTWRLWQALAAGCTLLGEPGDSWPFVAHSHYVPFGPITLDNVEAIGSDLVEMASGRQVAGRPLSEPAERALAELGHYTTSHCVDTYLVPASVEFRRA